MSGSSKARALRSRAVEGLQGTAHDLHVLLRHRLLPQPGGFEGLGLSPVIAPPDAFPPTPLGDIPEQYLERRVASCAATAKSHGCERQVSKVAHRDHFDREVGENVDYARVPAADSIVSAIRCPPSRPPLGRPRRQRPSVPETTQVPSVEGVKGLVSQLHVLLRHRPPSIPAARTRLARILARTPC